MTNTLSPFSTLADFSNKDTPNSIQHFLKKLVDPCAEDPNEDCGELLSPCCQEKLTTVFGTLPLEVKCEKCGLHHFLREIVPKELTTV